MTHQLDCAVYPKEWMQVLIAALITIVKTWKQPKRLSVGERKINCGTSL